MRTILRWSIGSLLLALLVFVPALAQDVALKPFSDQTFGMSGVIPDGWKEVGAGVVARSLSSSDQTVLAQQSAALPPDALLNAILPQFGLQTPPESVGTHEGETLTWTLYKVDVAAGTTTIAVDFALTSADGKTYLVLLQTSPDEYDALHESVFLPVLDALTPLAPEATAEDVPYTEEEVSIPNGDVTLSGTLTLPQGDGPHPAIVLVTGSGPQDRDESLSPALAIKPFRLITDALTRVGIAVLRYDDRGIAKSTGDFATATTADFASDASAAIDFLLTRDEIDSNQIGLLGHSEGGDVAAMLGANNPNLAFIVSMAGPAVSGADVLVEQNRRILQAQNASQEAIDAQLEFLPKLYELIQADDAEGIKTLTHDTVLQQIQFLPEDQQKAIGDPEAFATKQADAAPITYNTAWWRFFLSYNPGDDWAKTTIPVLAIYGKNDVQVDADQNAPAFKAAMEAAGNTDYQVTILPTANHLMQDATTGSPSEYGDLKQEFTPDFLPTLTDWLLQHVDVQAAS